MSGSAASLITASLETAGFIAQSEFLETFENFFRSAGALIAVLVGISGLFSVALFGNYKMARYLLLGPPIYWFLIGARTDIQETVWRLGPQGTVRSINQPTNVESARSTIRALVQNDSISNLIAAQNDNVPTSNEAINVSMVFKLYVNVIDGIITNFVNLLISAKDDQMLLNLGRARMLESILNSSSDNPEYATMLNSDFLTGCHPYIGALGKYGSHHFSQDTIDHLEEQKNSFSSDEDRDTYTAAIDLRKANRNITEAELKRLRNNYIIMPSRQTKGYLQRNKDDANLKSSLTQYTDNNQLLAKYLQGDTTNSEFPICCGAMWEILKHATLKEAKWFINKAELKHIPPELAGIIVNVDQPDEDREKAAEQLCQAIKEKLGKEEFTGDTDSETEHNGCDLSRLASILMLRNAIVGSERSKTISALENRMQLAPAVEEQYFSAQVPGGEIQDWEYIEGTDIKGNGIHDRETAKFRNKKDNRIMRMPLGKVAKQAGPLRAAYVEQQRATTRNLRQRIYTFALQLPYWQGVGLYMLAALYPFACLMVILPGRAVGMLTYALTWLWLKSWDIGFAAVMLLDSVLWNIFPKTDYTKKLAGKAFENVGFEDMVGEALRVDPAFNLHAYYMMVSMALFAIPPLTAAVILKGKNGVVSSFGDGAAAAGKDAGARAEGGYSANISYMYSQAQQILNDNAYNAQNNGYYQGLWQGMQETNSKELIAMSALTGARVKALTGGQSKGDPWITSSALAGAKTGISDLQKLFNAEVDRDIAYNKVFNPVYGRWSRAGIALESMANAIDPGGGYEIYGRNFREASSDLDKNEIALFKQRFSLFEGSISKIFQTITQAMVNEKPLKSVSSNLAHGQIPVAGSAAYFAYQDKSLPFGDYITEALRSWLENGGGSTYGPKLFGVSEETWNTNLRNLREFSDISNPLSYNATIGERIAHAVGPENLVGQYGRIKGTADPSKIAAGDVYVHGRSKGEAR